MGLTWEYVFVIAFFYFSIWIIIKYYDTNGFEDYKKKIDEWFEK